MQQSRRRVGPRDSSCPVPFSHIHKLTLAPLKRCLNPESSDFRLGRCAPSTRTLRAQSSEVSATRRREEGECCKERRSRVLEPYEGMDASSSQSHVFFCPTKKLVNPSFYECALTSSCRTPAAGAAPPPRAAASRARASRSQGWRRGSTRARPAAESPPQRARPARRTLPPHPIGR